MKKIVIATDSFKECLSGIEVAKCIRNGFSKEIDAKYYTLSIADGGEGTVESILDSIDGELIKVEVTGPLEKKVEGFYAIVNDVAIIEVAAACGLHHLSEEEKNPLNTSSYGVGELINDAIKKGITNFVIGLGGSATNDLGLGMLNAMGAKFYDKDGEVAITGGVIKDIVDFDLSLLPNINITIASDVTNLLYGETGATYVFGPQKGATSLIADQLENSIIDFSNLLKLKNNIDLSTIIGGGAAGGIGAALVGILNGELKSGFEVVSDIIGLEKLIKNADLVITGEGKMDSQSIYGKAPIGVAKMANKYGVETIAICGSISHDVEIVYKNHITSVFSVMTKPQDLHAALKDAKINIELTSRSIARVLNMKL